MKILLLVFNRPDLTENVLSRINQAKPDSLYIAADGPRHGHANDVPKCETVRKIVKDGALCRKTHHLLRDTNLGPLKSVTSAISWFFEHESEGIIVEDDCLPDSSFFRFCHELLSEYRDNDRIFMISGSNFLPNFFTTPSYVFSRLALVWGWATWRRAWNHFDPEMKSWPSYVQTEDLEYFGHKRNLVFKLINDQYVNRASRTWGILWRATFLSNKGLSIVPTKNLVGNIGFGHPDATHHKSYHKVADVPVQPMEFPLVHPPRISPNSAFDQRALDFYYDNEC